MQQAGQLKAQQARHELTGGLPQMQAELLQRGAAANRSQEGGIRATLSPPSDRIGWPRTHRCRPHRGQRARSQGVNQVTTIQQGSRTPGQPAVAARGRALTGIAGDDPELKPSLPGETGSMQSATGLWAFDQHHGPGQGHLQAVARREMAGTDAAAGRLFADQETTPPHLLLQANVMTRIDAIEARAQHGNGAPAGVQTTLMGRSINAIGQAADDRPPCPSQSCTNGLGHGKAMDRRLTGSHHGHRLTSTQG